MKEIALENRDAQGARLFSPSTARNKGPIAEVLQRYMPNAAKVLEIGSGTGEHAVHFAAALSGVRWQPSERDPRSHASIAAWIAHADTSNVLPPVLLDVTDAHWPVPEGEGLNAIVSLNMIHIAPFAAAEGLFAGAGRHLLPEGILFLYGPFSRQGKHTAPSNADFDTSLKSRDPSWGVRDLDHDLLPLARAAGLSLHAVEAMPANNFSVIFKKQVA